MAAILWYRSRCSGNYPETQLRKHGELKAANSLSRGGIARRDELICLTGGVHSSGYKLTVAPGHEQQVVELARRMVEKQKSSGPLIDILVVDGLPELEPTAV